MKTIQIPSGKTVYNQVPNGWYVPYGQTNYPTGCRWMTNGKSRFGGEFRHELVKEEAAVDWTVRQRKTRADKARYDRTANEL